MNSTELELKELAAQPVDEDDLWRRWTERADAEARAILIEHHLPFVKSIALSVYRSANPNYVDVRDLIQLGTLGLIDSVSRFEPSREIDFRGYAAIRIRGAILNGLKDLSEMHAQQAFRSRVRRERVTALRDQVAEAGKPQDLFAEMVELSVGLAIGYMLDGTSLYSDEAQSQTGYPDGTEMLIASNAFATLADQLPELQKRVIDYHYRGGIDFVEIAKLMGLTKGRISQIHHNALDSLRKSYKGRGQFDLRV